MAVVEELCGDDGALRAGSLTTLVDVIGGGLAAVTARPDWIATADLTLHVLRAATPETTSSVEARAQVLRAGRTTVVLEVDVVDVVERRVALATMSFAVLPRRADNPDVDALRAAGDGPASGTPPAAAGASRLGPGALERPYLDRLGVRVVDRAGGVVEVPVTDWSRNSMGAFQGGAVGAVLEAAAEAAARTATGRELVVTDLHTTYLSFGRVGPLRTRARVLAAAPHRAVTCVDLVDTGSGSRLMAVGRAVATEPLR